MLIQLTFLPIVCHSFISGTLMSMCFVVKIKATFARYRRSFDSLQNCCCPRAFMLPFSKTALFNEYCCKIEYSFKPRSSVPYIVSIFSVFSQNNSFRCKFKLVSTTQSLSEKIILFRRRVFISLAQVLVVSLFAPYCFLLYRPTLVLAYFLCITLIVLYYSLFPLDRS